LYSYAIALALRVADDPLAGVKAAQLALGAASALLAFAIALRLAGPLAATAAGLLLALYGPLVAIEAQLLREGPAIFGLLALLALLLRHLGPPLRGLRSAALLGVALGVFAMLHEVARVVALVAAVALALRHGAGTPRRALAPLAALAAGWLVGFAPLCVRNVTVGAPPFSVSSRMLLNLVESNVAGAPRGGAFASPPGAEVVQILDASHGSVVRAAVAVAATYCSDPLRLLGNWARRFAAICQRFEEADNVSYYLYREQTRALRWLPDFRSLFPLGVAGALAILTAALASRPAVARSRIGAALARAAAPALRLWERDPAAHAAVLGLGAAVGLSLSAVHVVGRFRLYVVPWLAIEAGIAVAILVRALAERRTACAGGIAASALAAAGVQALATHPASLPVPRTVDLDTAQVLALRHGDPELAAALADRARELDPHDPLYFSRLAAWLEREGRNDEAAQRYGQALEVDPFSRALREALARTRTGAPPP
jgi:tetratricopeptide (TPR) repeat protein